MDSINYEIDHKVKGHPEPFQAIWTEDKQHEIRFNDRNFQNRQTVQIEEWNPETQAYTGRAIVIVIVHLRYAENEGAPFSAGLKPGFVVFDFIILEHISPKRSLKA